MRCGRLFRVPQITAAVPATSATGSSSLPPCEQKQTARVLRAAAARPVLAAKAPIGKHPDRSRASKHLPAPANVSAKLAHRAALCDKHSPRSCASSPKFFPWREAAVSHLHAAPPKVQWQSPAWRSAHRVRPCELFQSPHGQTHRLVCSAICPGARLDARVQWFFCPA